MGQATGAQVHQTVGPYLASTAGMCAENRTHSLKIGVKAREEAAADLPFLPQRKYSQWLN